MIDPYQTPQVGSQKRSPKGEPAVWEITAEHNAVQLMRALFAPENLRSAMRRMEADDRAGGPDRVRAAALSNSEGWTIARAISECVLSGQYSPGRKRPRDIVKASGGTRTIRIANLTDAAVAAVLAQFCGPLIEPTYHPCSYGWRIGRNSWQVLALVKTFVERRSAWCLAHVDVKQAFDEVPTAAAGEAITKFLARAGATRYNQGQLDAVSAALRQVLEGGNPERAKGIDQGCPLSPIAMNCVLHDLIDAAVAASYKPFREADVAMWRYADNVIVAAPNVSDCRDVVSKVQTNLEKRDLELKKQQDEVVDLSSEGKSVSMLGFAAARRANRLTYTVADSSKAKLREAMGAALWSQAPQEKVQTMTLGWLAQSGPAIGKARTLDPRIEEMLSESGFDETTDLHLYVLETLETAVGRWETYLTDAETQISGTV